MTGANEMIVTPVDQAESKEKSCDSSFRSRPAVSRSDISSADRVERSLDFRTFDGAGHSTGKQVDIRSTAKVSFASGREKCCSGECNGANLFESYRTFLPTMIDEASMGHATSLPKILRWSHAYGLTNCCSLQSSVGLFDAPENRKFHEMLEKIKSKIFFKFDEAKRNLICSAAFRSTAGSQVAVLRSYLSTFSRRSLRILVIRKNRMASAGGPVKYNVRYCPLQRWQDVPSIGFSLEKADEAPHWIRAIESNSPASTARLVDGDSVIEVNGRPTRGVPENDVKQGIKNTPYPQPVVLLVADAATVRHYDSIGQPITNRLPNVRHIPERTDGQSTIERSERFHHTILLHFQLLLWLVRRNLEEMVPR